MNKEIKQSNRYIEMENVHKLYFPIFKSICQTNKYPILIQEMVDEFVIGRIGVNKGVRAFVFNELYKLAGGKDNISYLLAAVELHLASMYCFNVGADTKLSYNNKEKILTAFETRKIIFQLSLQTIEKFAPSQLIDGIKNIFLNTDNLFYEGQVLDIIVNIYKNVGKRPNDILLEINNNSDENIWQLYGMEKEFIVSVLNSLPNIPITDYTFQRTYGINAAMLENFGEIIGLILNLDREKIDNLKNYGKNFGMGMQIINDIQDYSLDLINNNNNQVTREKDKNDVFNDFKKGKITWPIKFAIENNLDTKILFTKIGDESIDYDECDKIREIFTKNSVFRKCVLEAAYYGKLANDSISNFRNIESRNILFEESASMNKFSKYIYVLEYKYGVIIRLSHSQIKNRMRLGNIYK